MGENDVKDIQIHIFEHVAPIRERMSHLEGRIDSHDREFKIVREKLDSLQQNMSDLKDDMLESLSEKHEEILLVFRAHEKIDHEKDDTIIRKVEDLAISVTSIKAWVFGAGAAIAGAYSLWEFVTRVHHG